RIALALTLALRLRVVDDRHLAVPAHDDQVAFLALHRRQVDELQEPFVARLERRLLGATARGAADVEGAHRELRARLADRLRRDDADRLAEIDHVPPGEVAAVALAAHALPGLAGENGSDLHALEACFLDRRDLGLVDRVVRLDDDVAAERIADVVERDAAENAVAEALDDLAAFDERSHLDPVERAAVRLGDDRVLRDVDEAAREVAGIGGLERRVGEALPRAVRRDEVLEHGEAFAEVRRDGRLDDLARRLRHETAHAGELADLLGGAPGAGVGHHEDRVERRDAMDLALGVLHLFGAELAEHLVRDPVGHLGPDVDDLVVALAVGDEPL